MAQVERSTSIRGKRYITSEVVKYDEIQAELIKSGAVIADDIEAGTINFDKLVGGTATLGGADNGNGELIVKDESGNTKVTVDKDGILVDNANFKTLEDELEISIMNFENLIPDHSFETVTPDYVTGIDETYYDYGVDSSNYWGVIETPRLISIANSEYPLTIAPTKYGTQSVAVTSSSYVTITKIINPNTTYFISGYFCNGNRTAGAPVMVVELLDAGLNVTGTTTTPFTSNSGQFNWKRDGVQIATGENDVAMVISLKSDGAGYAVWDSIQLIKNDIACVYDPESSVFRIDTGGGGELTDGDKGDITVSSSGATWTIDNKAVTLAKMNDMATASLIYRKTSGTGVPEVNSLATLKTDLGLTGTNSGDQVVPANTTATSNQFFTAYDSSTGGYTKAQPTWANIDKTTSSIADIATKSHTALSDVGTRTHAQLETDISGKVASNGAITGATKTKITYDAKGLVTSGADATTADIADSADKRYCTDAQKTVIGNTSGTNSGDNATNSQYSGLATSKVSMTGDETVAGVKTFSSFPITPSSAPTTDYQVANKKYVTDSITTAGGYTDEQAQDAVGAMVTGNTETGITVTYDDASAKLNFAVASQTDNNFTNAYKDAVDANTLKVSNATHTGDVTGATELTIGNDKVTYAKMQNVSATDKILGRSSSGSGDVEEITCTAAGRALLDDANVYIQRATLGMGASALNDNSGWIAFEFQPTYVSADDPTFVLQFEDDITGILSIGDRIKLTQTTSKYFIVTAIGSYSSSINVTVYGGTDYDLVSATITGAYYSHAKNPFGFPSDPNKWSVVVTDTTDNSQATPTATTWYNLGSVSITLPIGVWDTNYVTVARTDKATTDGANVFTTLSTANNSESDTDMTIYIVGSGTINSAVATKSKTLVVSSKTTYYLNTKTTVATGITSIRNMNAQAKLIIRAKCAYL